MPALLTLTPNLRTHLPQHQIWNVMVHRVGMSVRLSTAGVLLREIRIF